MLILLFQEKYASFWVKSQAESIPKENAFHIKIENTAEIMIFDDCYPYDITKLQKHDFLNLTNYDNVFARYSPHLEADLDEESLRNRSYCLPRKTNIKANQLS